MKSEFGTFYNNMYIRIQHNVCDPIRDKTNEKQHKTYYAQ